MSDPTVKRGARLAAEAIGTFMLVAIGAGAAAVNAWSGGAVTSVGVALAFGTVILAAIYAIGHLSGAHINPAVTIGFWWARRFPGGDVLPYILAQLVGATVAGFGIRGAVGLAVSAAVTLPATATLPALGVEVTLTFILMLVVMAVATDARVAGPVAGVALGATVAADAFVGGPLTGASMNPARSFGPALAAGIWTDQWIYWLAPILGAVLGVLAYDHIRPGTAHDHRTRRVSTAASRPVPLHGQLGPQPDG